MSRRSLPSLKFLLLPPFSLLACAPQDSVTSLRQPLGIARIEINQAIGMQHNGAAKYVAGKDAAIVVYLTDMVTIDPQTQRLVIRRDDSDIATLSPQIPPSGGGQATTQTKELVFVCPSKDACGGWQAGTYTFTAQIGDQSAKTSATFQIRKGLRILAVPLKARYGAGPEGIKEPDDKWKKGGLFVRATYPVAGEGFKWSLRETLDISSFDILTDEGQRKAWEAVAALNPAHCTTEPNREDCYDVIQGFVKEKMGNTQGYTFGKPAGITANDDEDMPATLAHEIAHPYGIGDEYQGGSFHCAVNPTPPTYKGKDFNNPDVMNYSCTDSMERGWDENGRVGTGTLVVASASHPFEVGGRGLLGDSVSFMGSGAKQHENWVTPRIYDRLFDQLAPQPPTPQAAGRVLSFDGFVHKNGAMESVTLLPWSTFEGTQPQTPASRGMYTIDALDSMGKVVASQNLQLDFSPATEPPRSRDDATFGGAIAFPLSVVKFQIRKGAAVLSEVPVSKNAPTVNLTAPAAGERLSGDFTIRWSATDLDGDPLTYTVEYSEDNGATWEVLSSDLSDPNDPQNFDHLGGSDQARIRVTASDGVLSGVAISGPLSVPAKRPEVYIDDPQDGLVLKEGETLTLEGGAFDAQDEEIVKPANLRWVSSKDGALGGGMLLKVSKLTPGEHTITLNAENSKGLTSSESVKVTVIARPPVMPMPMDMGSGNPNPNPNPMPEEKRGCQYGGRGASLPQAALLLAMLIGLPYLRRRRSSKA